MRKQNDFWSHWQVWLNCWYRIRCMGYLWHENIRKKAIVSGSVWSEVPAQDLVPELPARVLLASLGYAENGWSWQRGKILWELHGNKSLSKCWCWGISILIIPCHSKCPCTLGLLWFVLISPDQQLHEGLQIHLLGLKCSQVDKSWGEFPDYTSLFDKVLLLIASTQFSSK